MNTSNVQACATNGMAADSNSNCKNIRSQFVHIVWNSNATAGSLQITSSSGNASLQISITSVLQPGIIDSALVKQLIAFDSIPKRITCLPAVGGGCSITYNYQWQVSSNKVSWMDIPGATGNDLTFSSPIRETKFFRRKVNGGGTSLTSNVAVVFVAAPLSANQTPQP
jgi:hypothetical protein